MKRTTTMSPRHNAWGLLLSALALVWAGTAAAQSARPKAPLPAATCRPGDVNFFRDEAMTMKVATKLQFNKNLLREKIAVKVSGGVATLSGFVTTADLIGAAGQAAAQVEGIHCVNNQLTVGVAAGN